MNTKPRIRKNRPLLLQFRNFRQQNCLKLSEPYKHKTLEKENDNLHNLQAHHDIGVSEIWATICDDPVDLGVIFRPHMDYGNRWKSDKWNLSLTFWSLGGSFIGLCVQRGGHVTWWKPLKPEIFTGSLHGRRKSTMIAAITAIMIKMRVIKANDVPSTNLIEHFHVFG